MPAMMSASLRPRPSSTPTAAITRQAAGTSQDQIAQSSQTGHGTGFSAACDHQPRHLRQSAGDQRGYGVVPQIKTGKDARSDGNNIFQGAPEFHADNIVVGVDTESRIAEFLLHRHCDIFIGRCDGDCGRIALGNFFGKAWSTQRSDARTKSAAPLPTTSAITSVMRMSESFSMPLVALTNNMFERRCGCIA